MRSFFFILCVFLSVSCQNVERAEKPDNLIPEDKMVDVITEISLLHAARNYNKGMLEETGLDPDNYLWEKYDIDSLQFARSNDYYAENYSQYEAIYAEVKARLEGYRDIYDSLMEAEKRVQDSLRGVNGDTLKPNRLRKVSDSTVPNPDRIDPEPLESFRDTSRTIIQNSVERGERVEDTID